MKGYNCSFFQTDQKRSHHGRSTHDWSKTQANEDLRAGSREYHTISLCSCTFPRSICTFLQSICRHSYSVFTHTSHSFFCNTFLQSVGSLSTKRIPVSSLQGHRQPVSSECVSTHPGRLASARLLYRAAAEPGQAAQLCVFTLGAWYLNLGVPMPEFREGMQYVYLSPETTANYWG